MCGHKHSFASMCFVFNTTVYLYMVECDIVKEPITWHDGHLDNIGLDLFDITSIGLFLCILFCFLGHILDVRKKHPIAPFCQQQMCLTGRPGRPMEPLSPDIPGIPMSPLEPFRPCREIRISVLQAVNHLYWVQKIGTLFLKGSTKRWHEPLINMT